MRKTILIIGIFTFILAGTVYLSSRESDKLPVNNINFDQNTLTNSEQLYNQRQNIITKTVAEVSPAVVGINVTEVRQVVDPFFSPFFDDPFFRQYFGDQSYSREVKGLGSGFLISPDGYILTNDHVAGNATKIVVTLTNGEHYEAKVIGTDRVSDICLIKIEGKNFPYLALGNSDDVIIGEWSIALGNPFGLFDVNNKPTVTVGVISATQMNLDPVGERFYLNMIQTDAAINGGNSGGPLVNSIGEVIGMNTLIFSTNAQGSIGLGFAIPMNKIKMIVEELKAKGVIERDFVTGLSVQNIDDKIAKYFNLNDTKGVIINGVVRNSPADKAGLQTGDVILFVEKYQISNRNNLLGVLQEFRTGQKVTVTVLREGKELKFNLELEKKR
ncbi:MAG: trypsin-like peptidase domain-containing protein [Ignavibacteriaceae bacterium]|nr:trypsin-like peptidase domain-containing protein [Ignavibacteriaceae bacterium]